MHILKPREKGSKIYIANSQSICMNNDGFHEKITDQKVEETKNVQERKQIDKILQGIVKERMFGQLLTDDGQLSVETYLNLGKICKDNMHSEKGPLPKMHRTIDLYSGTNAIDFPSTERKSTHRTVHHRLNSTIKCQSISHHQNTTLSQFPSKKRQSRRRELKTKRLVPLDKLPRLQKSVKHEQSPLSKNKHVPIFHLKKLQIEERKFSELFRKFANNNTQMIYDVKVTRQNIYNRYKSLVDLKSIERFFHFFGFPQTMGYRQYCNLVENAVNCNLKYIYFFIFALIDQSGNGFVTISDMFRFMQKFQDVSSIESEIYLIAKEIEKVSKKLLETQDRQIEPLVEEMLVVNHNLKMEELKDLLKQSAKERIDVNCVKSTCYHQTVLSLDHDPLERLKQDQIQDTQLASRKIKIETENLNNKHMVQDGIRLRDFYNLFHKKRPKIFCLFINLLSGEEGSDYE